MKGLLFKHFLKNEREEKLLNFFITKGLFRQDDP